MRSLFFLLLSFLPLLAADDRGAAEWALRANGRVRLVGRQDVLTSIDQLPSGPLKLEAVDLIGTLIQPKELENLAHCDELRELLLPEPSFTTGAGDQNNRNDEFKFLASLKNLEKLHFSLHFLTNVNVVDKGLELLAPVTGLKELRLSQARVKGLSLKPFVNMERLELNYSNFNDEGMASLVGMKKLKVLQLRDTLITDRGMAHLGGLTDLEEVDLYGARWSDAGIRPLTNAKKLRKLNLLGSHITDDGLDALVQLPALEELVLYRSDLPNTGLA